MQIERKAETAEDVARVQRGWHDVQGSEWSVSETKEGRLTVLYTASSYHLWCGIIDTSAGVRDHYKDDRRRISRSGATCLPM